MAGNILFDVIISNQLLNEDIEGSTVINIVADISVVLTMLVKVTST